MNNEVPIDVRGRPVIDTDWSCSVTKIVTFAGGTTNDMGDYDGTGNPYTLFTVTGTVLIKILARCTTNLAGANATLAVGTALSATGLITTTTATDIDANEIWHDATPDSSLEATSVLAQKLCSQNVIQTVGTANITGGVIEYTAIWYPLSAGAKVVAA